MEVTNGRRLVSFVEKVEESFPRRWNELVIRVGAGHLPWSGASWENTSSLYLFL